MTIVRMPLPKLQRMNHGDPFGDGFLYRIGWPNEVSAARVRRADFDDRIRLKEGVGEHLLRVAGIIRPSRDARALQQRSFRITGDTLPT